MAPEPARRASVAVPSPALFRKVMSRFATGVTVITTQLDGEIFGMTANAFMAGSLVPPLCVISIGRHAKMHARLVAAARFGVSFLSEQQAPLVFHGGRYAALDCEQRLEHFAPHAFW